MNEMSIPTTFSIDFIDEPTKVNELISTVKARIYYKGGNRNGTWITDDFAVKLNLTLPHVPIVASYNEETGDFEDHDDIGKKRAYGFVPSSSTQEWIIGEDGKQYLTTDIYLWTGYWPEAAKIVNKSQSMELEKSSIMGDWKVVNGDYYFVYQTAAFKGLCALGDAVIPCFENSAFFSLDEENRSFFQSINEMNEKNLGGGNEKMEENQLIVGETFTPVEEVIVPTVEIITPIEEVIVSAEDFEKIIRTTDVVVVETTESDSGFKEESIRQESNQTVTEYPDNEEHCHPMWYSAEEFAAKDTEIAGLQNKVLEFENQLTTLKLELESLNQYKAIYVKQEKMNIVDKFKGKLSNEEITEFVDAIDNYTTEELRTKLSLIFTDKMLNMEPEAQPAPIQFVAVPGKSKESGIIDILRKNKK